MKSGSQDFKVNEFNLKLLAEIFMDLLDVRWQDTMSVFNEVTV